MTKNGRPLFYWDTNIWIAIIGEEKSNPIYEGAMYAMERVAKGDVDLILSEMVRLEMFKTNLNAKNEANFSKVLMRSNVEKISVNLKVVNIALDIQKEANRVLTGKLLGARDAVHLATAIYAKADELYVADGDLLALNGLLKMYSTPEIIHPPINIEPSLGL